MKSVYLDSSIKYFHKILIYNNLYQYISIDHLSQLLLSIHKIYIKMLA